MKYGNIQEQTILKRITTGTQKEAKKVQNEQKPLNP